MRITVKTVQRHALQHCKTFRWAVRDLFQSSTDIGGYPIAFLDKDNEILCADCARQAFFDRESFDSVILWEGPSEYCAECNREIPTAYGDPDAV